MENSGCVTYCVVLRDKVGEVLLTLYARFQRYLREMLDDRRVTGNIGGKLKRDKRDVFSSLVAALGNEQGNARLTVDDVFGSK